MDHKDPVAIKGTRKALKEMADGTLRVQIDIEPNYKAEFHKLFPDIDMSVAIAPMIPVAEGFREISNNSGAAADVVYDRYLSTSAEPGGFGHLARELRLSSFFRRPQVWRAVGTDQEFLDWLKTQHCAASVTMGYGHGGDVAAAHVRRVANGSGTGIKPEYSAIPLCDTHHAAQHSLGESMIGDREWWDKKRIEYLQRWCWLKLKADLGYASWTEVPPSRLYEWAKQNDVLYGEGGNINLPDCYAPENVG